MTTLNRLAVAFVATLIIGGSPGCAGNKTPSVAATTVKSGHDLLALAQDEEVQLCLGVPNVAAAATLSVVNRCSTDVAKAVGLTDARHQLFQAKMGQVLTLFDKGVRLTQAGAAATTGDQVALAAAVTDVLSMLATLQQTSAVTQLASNVKAGVQ